MKYWLITTEYPPFSGGGISTYCLQTARMLTSHDVQVTVFVPVDKKEAVQEKKKLSLRIVYFPIYLNSQAKALGREAAMSFSLSQIIEQYALKEGAPDIIESQEYAGIAYYTYQLKYLKRPLFNRTILLTTTHAPSFIYLEANEAPSYKLPQFFIGEMERAVLKMSDAIISPSQFLLDKINEQYDLSGIPQHVILNPYDHNNDLSKGYNEGEICFFGKLTPQKGCIEMLDYFDKLWKNGSKLKLRIIGGEDHFFYPKMTDMGKYLRSKYKEYIDDSRLIMEGHTLPERLKEALKSAHIILIPSRIDNLPYTVIEAMSMGKIILASTAGGHAEIIRDGHNGFLFNHSFIEFKNKLEHILSLSNEALNKIGTNAFNDVKREFRFEKIWGIKKSTIHTFTHQKESMFPFTRNVRSEAFSPPSKTDLLSIVIPYYNMGEYLEYCISSIEKSTYPKKEIIIVNDGSSDTKSIEILHEIERAGRATVYHKENSGLCDTRNYGASKVKSDYFAFLDPDDQVGKTYYTKAMRILQGYNNIHFVGCWAQYFGKDKEVWPSFNPEFPYLLVHNMINSSALVYKKEAFVKGGLNDDQLSYGMEDYESVINMMSNGYRGIVIPEILWNYRIRSGSMAQSFNRYSQIFLYKLFAKKHHVLYSQHAVDVVNLLNANGPGFLYDNPTKDSLINNRLKELIKKNYFLRKFAKLLYSKFSR